MSDLLNYEAIDCEKYCEGFQDGVNKILGRVKQKAELCIEREESFIVGFAQNEEVYDARIEAFKEILSYLEVLKE